MAVAFLVCASIALPTLGTAAVGPNWPGYLNGADHSSYQPAATGITASRAASLAMRWRFRPDAATVAGQPATKLESSPTVYNGVVYLGAASGMFYAVNESTGRAVWKRQFPWIVKTTCSARGFVSTATVAADPVTAAIMVYVAAPDGYLYALNASDGTTEWRAVVAIPSTTINDYFNWGSPTVAHGKIYIGISSHCDAPLVQGGVKSFDQATGADIATYFAVPETSPGASVWTSQAVDSAGNVYATTGNGTTGDSFAVVKLDGTTLTRSARFVVQTSEQSGTDDDFGGSPTLFTAVVGGVSTPMVGACNKNGTYYALRQSDLSLVWSRAISVASPNDKTGGPGQCDAAATWDGNLLYEGTNATTIGATSYHGSVRALDPSSGAVVWETGLPAQVIGSTSLNGGGIVAAPMMGRTKLNGVALLSASTGALLRTLATSSQFFAQPVWADGYLIVAGEKRAVGLQAWS